MEISPRIALVAHDARKPAMNEWALKHYDFLSRCELYGTGTTGGQIAETTGLKITRLLSGPLGGDQQIGAMIAEKRLDVLIFFFDPLSAVPHDVDVKALLRIATLYHTAVTMNERTADLVVSALEQEMP
ncbi:methylglyoxal synthase [Suttonella ornithocola]|uniref:Methylglyoxal synthase n=1 Tax=Suttonella ornithocola TaxID=279832 RepID=A0A380MZP4_9GAMM|nr:methylglyoxal synthase [Suttonella ornithocola]SUO97694.1 Methylglyoxal synthase [Suttonella ornithocola]